MKGEINMQRFEFGKGDTCLTVYKTNKGVVLRISHLLKSQTPGDDYIYPDNKELDGVNLIFTRKKDLRQLKEIVKVVSKMLTNSTL